MEKMIRDIVDADREARLRLLEKQKEKDNIQSLIRQERESIKAKYQQDAQARIQKKREELEEQLSQQKKIEDERYEKTSAQLQQHTEHGTPHTQVQQTICKTAPYSPPYFLGQWQQVRSHSLASSSAPRVGCHIFSEQSAQ